MMLFAQTLLVAKGFMLEALRPRHQLSSASPKICRGLFSMWTGALMHSGPVRVNAETDMREFMRIDMGRPLSGFSALWLAY